MPEARAHTVRAAERGFHPAFVLAWFFCLVFFSLTYVLRSAPGVMIPELSAAFGLTALGVSSLVGLYYYTLAGFSVVAGASLDRYGATRRFHCSHWQRLPGSGVRPRPKAVFRRRTAHATDVSSGRPHLGRRHRAVAYLNVLFARDRCSGTASAARSAGALVLAKCGCSDMTYAPRPRHASLMRARPIGMGSETASLEA